MSHYFWVETVYFVRLRHLPELLQPGQEGSKRRTEQPSSEQRPPVFCPPCCWYWQTDGVVWGYVSLTLVGVWYWSLVCNAGAELVDAESHTHTLTRIQVSLWVWLSRFLFMCVYYFSTTVFMFLYFVCILNMCPSHDLMHVSGFVNHDLVQGHDAACHLVSARARPPWKDNSCLRCLSLKNVYSLCFGSHVR